MPNTSLMGEFSDYEPRKVGPDEFPSTDAMPGTKAKIQVLAERVRRGIPLWHPGDKRYIEKTE